MAAVAAAGKGKRASSNTTGGWTPLRIMLPALTIHIIPPNAAARPDDQINRDGDSIIIRLR
jgi:hypothetical protein